ncbi:GTP cyclohydrolase I FolE [Colwellia sp. MB02u-9]|uniref:GTP cyclohydrolase I FolE n=1 Tax=Colwellia sp. MB02u-9 TaxID=2759823 RepID=UPI0015F7319D|nr:GTP cyclohydrolase I FolE [Colwellia sp. MB02u-9]MBA6295963.1 GTP cyclohydrolase I FolE [Colwellia sp. MB02u-9]
MSIEKNYQNIISAIGEDINRDGLIDTPKRAAKAMEFLTQGYHQNIDDIVNGALFESDADEMVVIKNIELYSMCEHHMLPFIGKCHIAYIPSGKVLGLSKFARIVDMYSRRLQIQENLAREIALSIQEITGSIGVGVIIEAQHLCMMMRGVQKQNSSMTTSVMLGEMREDASARQEMLALVKS